MIRFISRLGLSLAGLVVPFLVLELGVRLLGLAPPPEPNPAIWAPHPLLGWWHIPHSGGLFHSDFNEFEAEVRINARSLRDREIGYDNPTGAFRVLSLADSFGEALQVELEDTYHKQLERLLADPLDRPVEVLNAGVGGWGTDQEAIFYVAEGFRYKPDVVLLAFFVRNDAVNNYGPLEMARNGGQQQKEFFSLSPEGRLLPPPLEERPEPELNSESSFQAGQAGPQLDQMDSSQPPLLPVADTLWRVSALYRFFVPYLRNVPPVVQQLGPSGILGGEAVIRANHPPTPIPFFVYRSPPDEQFEAAWSLTEAIISRLQEEVTSRGARLAVVIIAAPEQVYPEDWTATVAANPDLADSAWDLEAPNRRLDQFLTAQGIPYLDLLPVFRRASNQPATPRLHFQHDQHWTEAGHRLAAEAIYEFLLKEALVGQASRH